MFVHARRVFTAALAFTACAALAAAAATSTNSTTTTIVEPQRTSVDNDGTYVFSSAAFVHPAGWPAVVRSLRASEHLGPGVDFERWHLDTATGPLTLSITRVDLRNPDVDLRIGTRNDQIIGFGEALSTMADRSGAEAGINADYYDISGSGMPTNLVLSNGVVQHQPNGRAAFVVGQDKSVSLGPVAWQLVVTGSSGVTTTIDTVNDWSASTQLMLFTQRFGLPGAAGGATEVILEPQGDGGYRVAKAAADQPTFFPLRPDDLGIAARGAAGVALLQNFHAGDSVRLSQQWTPGLIGPREGVGGGPLLLKGGVAYEDPNAPSPEERDVRYPLTGAGISADGATLWLVAIDGRAPSRSVGVTRPMLGALLASLGASDAMAFDSGGSTEMVVRRLGDAKVSVANVPSDGRERSIADGLFVVNSASPGPPARLVLRADAQAVLAGSHLAITAQGVDANDQPVPASGPVTFSVASGPATIDANGVLAALRPGEVDVVAQSGAIRGEFKTSVVASVAQLAVARLERAYPPSVLVELSAVASAGNGAAIAVDRDKVAWSAAGDAGVLGGNGVFKTAAQPSKSVVIARAGGARADAELLVGAHKVALQSALPLGEAAGEWHLYRSPAELSASLESGKAPDGASALHLSFDLGAPGGSRAAGVQSEIAIPGEPLVVNIEVYGDASGAWLRGAYRNGDGINESLTLARHVDWNGWRTINLVVPVQARWPITWTRFYVVAPPPDKAAGDLWLRGFGAWYAGPGTDQRASRM